MNIALLACGAISIANASPSWKSTSKGPWSSYGPSSYGPPASTVTVTVGGGSTCAGSSGIATDVSAPTATVDDGILHGTTTSLPAATASVNKFLGVPFAVSPPERFSPPQQLPDSQKIINATAWSPACIQQFVCESAIQFYA